MGNFKDILEQYFKKLELYIPVVERVHGENHPEFYDVRKLFDQIAQKIGNLSKDKPKLDGVFKELRKLQIIILYLRMYVKVIRQYMRCWQNWTEHTINNLKY